MITRPRGGAGRVLSANRRAGSALLAGRYLEVAEADVTADLDACAARVLRFLREDDLVVSDGEVVVDLLKSVSAAANATEPVR